MIFPSAVMVSPACRLAWFQGTIAAGAVVGGDFEVVAEAWGRVVAEDFARSSRRRKGIGVVIVSPGSGKGLRSTSSTTGALDDARCFGDGSPADLAGCVAAGLSACFSAAAASCENACRHTAAASSTNKT